MTKYSPIAKAPQAAHGAKFSALRLDLTTLDGLNAPIMGFDHFSMAGPTFAPHPHAGFSAVSYIFPASPGSLRNRDSLGNDVVIQPGEMVWTQAASGVIHDEFPAVDGVPVYGLQLFVNLAKANKGHSPQMFHAKRDDIPQVKLGDSMIRVVAGDYAGAHGPVQPIEPFLFLDALVVGRWELPKPTQARTLLYVVSGAVEIDDGTDKRGLRAHEAIVVVGLPGDKVWVEATGVAQVLVLSGADSQEPVATYGPFIMNDQAGLQNAYSRYVSGDMGRLDARS